MLNVNEVKEKLKRALEKHPEVVFAYLHGSVLETEHPRDVDVALYVVGVEDPLKYELSIAVELERCLGKETDVRILNDAPPSFRYRVVSKGEVILSRDEEKRLSFVERTVEEYLDFEPLERTARRELLAM
ncbi:nucleotidyltransferase domain-containing protein [Thermococcus sp. 21S7]|uniref:type VII toxin-antitoxin system MntA family adenylyltransferase antitoxin n=1 Tax=Thermococcus sp. 21S7 TaxID=1638221 RepID=UPI00143B19EF|nr:nucleotidyltransferase domain-containing protein [Thermococcus sp. 21S7]NJE60189.1 nucleotidyltransferase domain-containing protein [Thermococcus sp. 21S7]